MLCVVVFFFPLKTKQSQICNSIRLHSTHPPTRPEDIILGVCVFIQEFFVLSHQTENYIVRNKTVSYVFRCNGG